MKLIYKIKVILSIIISITALIFCVSIVVIVNPTFFNIRQKFQFEDFWEGTGCKDTPFLINNVLDLITLRDCVNSGISFEGYYFQQTCNLDLGEDSLWIPIGEYESGNYFYGTYDGDANYICNLNFQPSEYTVSSNGALSSMLGGQVLNLGIESGRVEGLCVGSIASHATGFSASIVNCYNKATVVGSVRAGGICDNFSGGSIVNCVNYGEVSAPQSAQIVSYNASSVMNVYPIQEAVSADFQGIFVNYYSMPEEQTISSFLNKGIQFLDEMQVLPTVELDYWNE